MADSPLHPTDISKNLSLADGNLSLIAGEVQSSIQFTSPSPNMIPFNSTDTGSNNTTILTTFKNVSIQVIQIVICIAILIGNLMIIIAIRRSEKLKSVYHFWMAHLAIADFVTGVLIAIQMFLSSNNLTTIMGCRIFYTAALPTFSASIFGLFMVSYTSYKCTRSLTPIVNLDCLERQRVKIQIGCVWIFWVLFYLTGMLLFNRSVPMYSYIQSCSLISAQINGTFLFVVSVIILVGVLIVGIFQCMIVKEVNAHTEKMLQNGIYKVRSCKKVDEEKNIDEKSINVPLPSDKRLVQISQNEGNEDTPNNKSSPSTRIEEQDSCQSEPTTITHSKRPSLVGRRCVENDSKQTCKVLSQNEIQYQMWTKKVSKLTKTLAIVFSLFAICALPHSINLILLSICHFDFCQSEILLAITSTFLVFNSFANVIVYTIRNKDFRDEFKNILCLRGKIQV